MPLSHVMVIVREHCGRDALWGTAKVYPDDGIRYSMRIGTIGATNHIPGPRAMPDVTPVTLLPRHLDANGYGLAVVDASGIHDVAVDEAWLDDVLAAVRADYDIEVGRWRAGSP